MNLNKTLWTLGSIIGARQAAKAVQNLEWNDILGVVGLERRPSAFSRALPALGLIAVSAAVGAGAALLFAPSSGDELRNRLSDGLDGVKNRLDEMKDRANERISEKVDKISDKVASYEHHSSNSTS